MDSHASLLPSHVARTLAMEAHQGQVDKVGQPYIGHPARIAMAVRAEGYADEVEAVAWLHDVVEDTDVSLDLLRSLGFSGAVVEAVDAISKRKGEKFEAYYERVKANPMALVVKWHDVADNADPARLAKVAPDTRERLRAKYERAKALLAN
jgi:(p)ppGpp synthase/HD superfamily hydrolase